MMVPMFKRSPRGAAGPLLASLIALLTGCASPTVTASPPAPPSLVPTLVTSGAASPSGPIGSPDATANATGFAFTADDVVAYYESQGYTCSVSQPSTKARGFFVRSCELMDDAGRTRVIGLVTDPAGGMANGFASVQGTDTETFLPPVEALDPLAGFLGAMLGEAEASTLLPWLAGHLGDAYAETAAGPIKVATYTESADDHSKLYVEVANQAYLDAPGVEASPSPSPSP
jgi:hypothetical protein